MSDTASNSKKQKDFDFAQAMKKLESINQWFGEQEIDLEQGLDKLREGKDLIVACRQRLQAVENEFSQIKDELSENNQD